jgi:ABC-2 type transport system ATP-binding protein
VDRFALDTRVRGRAYSKGNRQKVALVAALAADTELLVLDEPTSGLDPLMEEVFRRTVAEERDRGRTVLLSSHILAEVEALCDRVSIVRAGRTVESGTLDELRHLSRITVTAVLAAPPEGLSGLPGVHDLEVDGDRLRLHAEPAALAGLCTRLGELGVRDLGVQPPTLEELFLRHYDTVSEGAR